MFPPGSPVQFHSVRYTLEWLFLRFHCGKLWMVPKEPLHTVAFFGLGTFGQGYRILHQRYYTEVLNGNAALVKAPLRTSSAPTNQLHSFPLMRKKVPAATPSRPTVRPSPQNTAGPILGCFTSTAGDRKHRNMNTLLLHLHIWRQMCSLGS